MTIVAFRAGCLGLSAGTCPLHITRSHFLTGVGGDRRESHSGSFQSRSNFRNCRIVSPGTIKRWHLRQVQALVIEPSDGAQENLDEFVKRMEQTWLITRQPRPVQCKSCETQGQVECQWCKGTGFFILGDTMLCEVPSRNTTCRVCFGKGTLPCDDCKGTGFRARWLGEPPIKKKP